MELINIWSYPPLHLKKFNFNFILTHSTILVLDDCFTIAYSLISELMVAYHSLLGKSRHVKACDRRQMFALPLSRRVSASKGLCASQIFWHQVTKNRKQQKKQQHYLSLFLCHIHTLHNKNSIIVSCNFIKSMAALI